MTIKPLFIIGFILMLSHAIKAYDTPPARGTYPPPEVPSDFNDDFDYAQKILEQRKLAKERQKRKWTSDDYDVEPTRTSNPYRATPYREAEDMYQPQSSHKKRAIYQDDDSYQQKPSLYNETPSPRYQPGIASRYQSTSNDINRYRETDFDHYPSRDEDEEYQAAKKIKRKRTEQQSVEDERIAQTTVKAPPSTQESKKGFIDTVTEKAESLNLEQKADTALKLTNTANKLLSMFGGFSG